MKREELIVYYNEVDDEIIDRLSMMETVEMMFPDMSPLAITGKGRNIGREAI